MAEKKQVIIIKKKKIVAGHGHHGGAWKVAYADFVTAMMAFFLVMWLMGSDEETKAAIEHYFNHPNTPWTAGKDPMSSVNNPLGDKAGVGQNILQGMDGKTPEDLVERVVRPSGSNETLQLNREMKELVEEILEGQAFAMDVSIDYMKFSVPMELLFEEGNAKVKPSGHHQLDKLGQLFRGYPGYIKIEGHTNEKPEMASKYANSYEFSLERAVSVMNYLVENRWTREEKLIPSGSGARNRYTASEDSGRKAKNNRIEFTLTTKRTF